MALISCPECGKEVSDKASSCPNCGVNIVQYSKKDHANKKDLKKRLLIMCSVVFILVCTVFGYVYYDATAKCNEIYSELEDIHYTTVLEELETLPEIYFKLCGSSIIEKYKEIILDNKIEGKPTETGSGLYLGMESYEFVRWSQLHEIGVELQRLGANEIENYVTYAKQAEELQQYSEYDNIINFWNTKYLKDFLGKIFIDLNEDSIQDVINAINEYYDVGMTYVGDEYINEWNTYVTDYAVALTKLSNSYHTIVGINYVTSAANELQETLSNMQDFILEIGVLHVDVMEAIYALPDLE